MRAVPIQLDHLVIAGPALDESIEFTERKLGVRTLAGGQHPDWGTRNAIVPLSESSYIEVIGPDPGGKAAPRPALFGISNLDAPRLVTSAAKSASLQDLAHRARTHNIDLGRVLRGSRVRPDGTMLTWEFTDPLASRCDGILPFFIDWGASPHPAGVAPAQVRLLSLRARHPDPDLVARQLEFLGIAIEIEQGDSPGLIADFQAPTGRVTLT